MKITALITENGRWGRWEVGTGPMRDCTEHEGHWTQTGPAVPNNVSTKGIIPSVFYL